MIHKVDWISFTVEIGIDENRRSDQLPAAILKAMDALHPGLGFWLVDPYVYTPSPGRKPYSVSWWFEDRHLRIFAHPNLSHALIEISGQGCALLEDERLINDVLSAVLNRLTRLDIASDMLTETRPTDFVQQRNVGRFKSSGFITSPSGETCYVGSKTSDRYARVYRYNPPHERSHLLRVEVQLKKMNARLAAQTLLDTSVETTARMLGQVFEWQHKDWQPETNRMEIMHTWRPERHTGKTDYWIEAQVVPALSKHYAGRPGDLMQWFGRLWQRTFDEPLVK